MPSVGRHYAATLFKVTGNINHASVWVAVSMTLAVLLLGSAVR